MVQKVASSNPGLGQLGSACDGKTLFVSPAVMGTCFESGKVKAAKGEGWVLSFICSAQVTMGH